MVDLIGRFSYNNDSWKGYEFNLNDGGFVSFFYETETSVHQYVSRLFAFNGVPTG